MREDELKQILSESEADLAPPKLAPDLARRVRAREARARRRRRVALAAGTPLVIAALVGLLSLTPRIEKDVVPRPAPVAASPMLPADLSQEIARLEAEAERHERLARILIAAGREPRASDPKISSDPLADVREQVDIVAYRMILRADELRSTMDPPRDAIGIYREVLRLFPATYSAEVASERLMALGAHLGET